jgi:hypothetical protein
MMSIILSLWNVRNTTTRPEAFLLSKWKAEEREITIRPEERRRQVTCPSIQHENREEGNEDKAKVRRAAGKGG